MASKKSKIKPDDKTKEELILKYDDKIQKFTLMDDSFMSVVFKNKECAEILISVILKKILKIISVNTQYEMSNLKYRSVRLDIFAEDENGVLYNIEVQNDNEGATPERARYNASSIDVHTIAKGEDVKNLPTTYVILITRNDVIGKNKPLYTIKRTIEEDNHSEFGDRQYIIYVNSQIRDTTELGKLMHDFYCTNPEDMYNKKLADEVEYYKNKKRGEYEMCAIMDSLMNEAATEAAIKTTIEIYQDLNFSESDTIKKVMEKFSLTKKDATLKVKEIWAN